MDETQRANLLKLADGLEGPLSAAFHMGQFSDDETEMRGKPTCGAIGCAVGHATYIVEPLQKNTGLKSYENWVEYSNRLFGLYRWGESSSGWGWCFSHKWAHIDNTPKGAAKRIRYLVEHGKPPEWLWRDDFPEKYRNWRKRGVKK